jgi:hypothetical protein
MVLIMIFRLMQNKTDMAKNKNKMKIKIKIKRIFKMI